jgi:hypothetical protein
VEVVVPLTSARNHGASDEKSFRFGGSALLLIQPTGSRIRTVPTEQRGHTAQPAPSSADQRHEGETGMHNSRSLAVGLLGIAGFAALIGWSARAQAPTPPDCKAYPNNTSLSAELIVPGMLPPCAPAVNDEGPFRDAVDNLQHGFDLYSWLTFVALNSPVDGRTRIGDDAPTVWESYRQLPDLMLEDGREQAEVGRPGRDSGCVRWWRSQARHHGHPHGGGNL